MRVAYLDLLKLTLCDLATAGTSEVRWTGDKRWFSRQLTSDEQLAARAEGKDWPLNGLTMIGLRRLDGVQQCVESVIRDQVRGDVIEAGTWRGGASIMIRATLDSLGAHDRQLWLADSFEGFPPADQSDLPADRALETDLNRSDFFAPGLGAVQSYFRRFGLDSGVRFVPGFFEDTLEKLRGQRWSLVRLDADTYTATKLALEALYPGLAAGGYVVLDDYFHPWLPECRKAVDEFRAEQGITEPIHQVDWNGGHWRRESQPDAGARAGTTESEAIAVAKAEPVKQPPRIPTDRELQLGDELAEMRQQVEALRTRIDELTSSPFRRARAWMSRRRQTGD